MDLDFALVQFEGENTASIRLAEVRDRGGAGARWVGQAGLVEHHHNGRLLLRGTFAGHYLDVDESDHVSQKGAGEGAVAGGLIGVLAGPVGIAVGLVVGGVVGSQVGAPSDAEDEPQALVDRLREALPRSRSAIVLIAPPADVDEMMAAIGEDAGRRSRQALGAEQVAALEASLSAAPRVSPGSPGEG